MTGDIAEKNDEGGYETFLGLIEALGTLKPPPTQILVVPGNHDVVARLKVGDPRRYGTFVKFIRGAGFVTPWLEGVDGPAVGSATDPLHLLTVGDVQIVPIDSAAFSQVRIDVGISDTSWNELELMLAARPDEQKQLSRLRIVDAARVSSSQLEALRATLAPSTGSPPPLRIAALHHHLLPVSLHEEIKPFESFTNLGLLRSFLRDQGVATVLHGHKHNQWAYIDHIASYARPRTRLRLFV